MGISFRFHPLFIMVMLSSVITGYFLELMTLFAIVLIHELGHIAAAKGFGWRIREVQFLPFGGVAVVDDQGTFSAWEEMLVALAGPLQNGIMIGLAVVMHSFGLWESDWGSYFIQANMMIGLFNLLPVLPLDGGKIMQSLISLMLNYHRTIVYCTWISLVISTLIIVFSVLQIYTVGIQLNLLMVGLFLFYVNWYHRRNIPYQYLRFLMNREDRVSKMIERGVAAQPIIVKKSKKIGEIVHLFMREKYHLIYIINELGILQEVIPEQQIVQKYFTEKVSRSAVSDFFM